VGGVTNATRIYDNLNVPCCVVVLIKGAAINCERRLAEHAEIAQKSMFNCRFQVKRIIEEVHAANFETATTIIF
jgi:hypothetical protein